MAAAAPRFDTWLEGSAVAALSSKVGDPPAIARFRQESHAAFLALPLEPDPLYRKYGYFAGVDLHGLNPLAEGPPVVVPAPNPTELQIVHDAAGTHVGLPSVLERAGVRVETLGDILRSNDGAAEFLAGGETPTDRLTALSIALVNRGTRLTVPDDCPVPVQVRELIVLSQPHEGLAVRRQFRLGRRARLLASEQVFSTSAPDHQRWYASSTDVRSAPDSTSVLLTLHAPDPKVVSVYRRSADVGTHARLRWIWSGFGGFRTRCRNFTDLTGNGSDVDDLQTFYGDAEQSYDSYVKMTHVGTDTHARSITRGVFQGQSRGMSRGLVRIEKEARRTLSYISEHAMLLSRGARSDTVPILEILCRDVKATHSSSVAPVDPEKVFYLESRGIDPEDAVRMLAEGFLSYVLERSPIDGLREQLLPIMDARWGRRPVLWTVPNPLALQALAISTEAGAEEWRFDSKLL
ncbi:MAG: SufD family Fe-S cluster assembly protein [Thermoplasmata archaeon]|nr:SufD family Fe-S cluster assembly protein [Thermoplasmata archaeon]